MKDYIILVDSTADLVKEVREKYNIDYVPMNVVVNVGKADEEEIKADLDWGKYSFHEFYELMRNGVRMKTTQVSYQNFEDTFQKALNEGKDVLYIACSSALSGSVNTAVMCANELLANNKEGKIICVDSLCASIGQGMMAIEASKLKAQGKNIDEVATWLENNKLKYNQFATVETLNYLKNAGRIKASKAFFGNIVGVKPIIISDVKGSNYAYTKVKGRKTSLDKLVEDLKAAVEGINAPEVNVVHADAQEGEIKYLVSKIKLDIPGSVVNVYPMGPIIGVSTGPGTFGVFAYGKEVTIEGE